jgi:hypothetical protein
MKVVVSGDAVFEGCNAMPHAAAGCRKKGSR